MQNTYCVLRWYRHVANYDRGMLHWVGTLMLPRPAGVRAFCQEHGVARAPVMGCVAPCVCGTYGAGQLVNSKLS